MGPMGTLDQFYNGTNFQPGAVETSAEFSLHDGSGADAFFDGTGFNYFSGIPFVGTIQDVTFFNSSAASLITVSGISVPVASLQSSVSAHDPQAILTAVNGGDDHVTGSSLSDDKTLTAGAGNDIIHGKGCNDIINGGDGNDKFYGDAGKDTLTGRAGADAFVFVGTFGKDTIIDFTNTGAAGSDKLWITQAMSDEMTVSQTTDHTTSTHLLFGANEVTLTNVHATDVNAHFFHIKA